MISIALYFIPILLCALTPFFKELSANRGWFICCGVYLCLFYCFGYMTGTDWRVYEDWYYSIDFNRLFYDYYAEPGYYIFMLLFRFLGVGFWPFFILTKTVIFIIIYKTIFDYCKESGYLTLMYFLPWFGMYLLIDNPMRNCIAIAIFIVSARFVIEHKFWKFLLCMLLASSFHFTAIVMILVYPMLNHNVKSWIYVLLFLSINIVFSDREMVINVINSTLGRIPYIEKKIFEYLILDSEFAKGKLFSFGMLWQIGIFILLICYRDRIINYIDGAKGLFVFNAVMFYMLFLRFAMTIEAFSRIQLYFSVFLAIAVGLVLLSFDYKSRIIYICVLLLVSLYICFGKITITSRYVPYSNVVSYIIKGDFPSYSERFFYNYRHSPYKSSDKEE